jgi:hypothetical protein
MALWHKSKWTGRHALAVLLLGPFLIGAVHGGEVTPPKTVQTYLDGLIAGEAQGREEGRALQFGQALPADARRVVTTTFVAGYTAGADDVFGGYDGGWAMQAPYVVTLVPGKGAITYRIGSRAQMQPGIAYFLCPDGHSLCQAPRK